MYPAAENETDEAGVRGLLAGQQPDLAGLPLARLDAGWDNTLWRLGEELLVRLPRRRVAVDLIVNEQRWLPLLAPRLPLPVPAPVRLGRPSPSFPWPWSVVPWLGGEPGDRAVITDPDDAARRLGGFLAALHQAAPPEAPTNPFRGGPLADRTPAVETRLSDLGAEVDGAACRRVWDRALDAEPWDVPPVWLHGDLHPANTLIQHGTLAAVIDFGDVCAGDPATDLAGAWMLLPASAIAAFTTAYGGVDLALERRTLGWVVTLSLMLIAVGIEGRPTYLRVGRSALAKAIARSDT